MEIHRYGGDCKRRAGKRFTCGCRQYMGNPTSLQTPLDMGIDLSPSVQYQSISAVIRTCLWVSLTVRDEVLYRRLRDVSRYLGYGVSPEDCSLVLRGIETLPVRLDRSEANALAIARWLEDRPEVVNVLHPALPSHPGHELWQRDFLGSSGLFSVILQPWTRSHVAAVIGFLGVLSASVQVGVARKASWQ